MNRTEVAHGVAELVDQPSGELAEHRLLKPADAGSTPALGSTHGAPRIRERRPRAGLGWDRQPDDSVRHLKYNPTTIGISVWRRGMTTVISALEVAEYPDGKGDGPQWHLSISHAGERPRPNDMRRVLRAFAFGLVDLVYDEDNHHPGVARHLWIPVDPAHRVACQCKVDERTIVEPDGYRWTTPADGPCSGCDFAALVGKPCFLHPEVMP